MLDLSPLFTPFDLGGLKLPNRIAMAPMTRQKSPDLIPGDDVAAYYARRAAGGVGLIIAEATTIDEPAASPESVIPAFHGASLDGWRKVCEAVHAEGGLIIPQLWHLGMVRRAKASPRPDVPSIGPSGLFAPGRKATEPMTDAQIEGVIDGFVRGAADAKAIGFDGVELHGAHGYLIDQFFWDGLNERTDSWGGDMDARGRFAVEIIRRVRKAVGPDFPVILRWSQWKTDDYKIRLTYNPTELERFLAPLADAGLTAFHCSTRRFWEPEFPDTGSDLNLAGWTKKVTGLPTITVGSIGLTGEFSRVSRDTLAEASTAYLDVLAASLERGDFDVAAVGRALVANPDWANLVREGRFDEIAPYSAASLAELV